MCLRQGQAGCCWQRGTGSPQTKQLLHVEHTHTHTCSLTHYTDTQGSCVRSFETSVQGANTDLEFCVSLRHKLQPRRVSCHAMFAVFPLTGHDSPPHIAFRMALKHSCSSCLFLYRVVFLLFCFALHSMLQYLSHPLYHMLSHVTGLYDVAHKFIYFLK